jgi:hypothetical protein
MVPANQDFTQQQDLPLFAGKYAPHTGNLYEGHPSLNPVTSRSRPLLLDVHPFIGAGFMSAGGTSVAHVSGTLYRIDNYSEGGNFPDGLSRKHFPTLASCGLNPLQDISSAATGNVLSDTSADSYKYCVANAAGECRTGSTAGQIFFNCPYVAPDKRTCTQASQDATDVCIGDFSARGGHHMIYELPGTASTTTDAARLLNRSSFVLLTGLVTKGAANTSNDKMLPFNNWALSGAGGPIFNQPIENVLIKVPRLAGYDSVNRASFVPVDVSLGSVPDGTNNVIVEFGYGEHGAPTNFYCATRRETCIAVGATINEATPFYFASETFSGATCSSSCTVAIPAVSGRLVFYRIKYRDAGNVVLATGPTQVGATP